MTQEEWQLVGKKTSSSAKLTVPALVATRVIRLYSEHIIQVVKGLFLLVELLPAVSLYGLHFLLLGLLNRLNAEGLV